MAWGIHSSSPARRKDREAIKRRDPVINDKCQRVLKVYMDCIATLIYPSCAPIDRRKSRLRGLRGQAWQ